MIYVLSCQALLFDFSRKFQRFRFNNPKRIGFRPVNSGFSVRKNNYTAFADFLAFGIYLKTFFDQSIAFRIRLK